MPLEGFIVSSLPFPHCHLRIFGASLAASFHNSLKRLSAPIRPSVVVDEVPQHLGTYPRGVEAQILHGGLGLEVSHYLAAFEAFQPFWSTLSKRAAL